jgi:hypothetical protein
MTINRVEAIQAIKSDVQVTQKLDGTLVWHDGNPTNITDEQISAKMVELQEEYDALDYARNRKASYPSLNEFAEAYTEKEIVGDSIKWDAYVINYNKVRSDNPKN